MNESHDITEHEVDDTTAPKLEQKKEDKEKWLDYNESMFLYW